MDFKIILSAILISLLFSPRDTVLDDIASGQIYNVISLTQQEEQPCVIDDSTVQRFTTDDPAVIRERINRLKGSGCFNIVIIGDSIIYGDGTIDESKTTPSLLKSKLPPEAGGKAINVFNFTLPSAGPAEVYLITRELADAKIDLFIYDINIGWFGRAEALEHPVLLKLDSSNELNPADFRVYDLDQAVPNNYNIYELDENLIELSTPWDQKNWDGVFNPEVDGRFGHVDLVYSEQWDYNKKIVSLLQENKIKSLFFSTPRNFEMLDQYDAIDYGAYNATLQSVFYYLDSEGIMILKLDDAVPSKYFSDAVHLLPGGEEIVADRLSEYITQEVIAQ